MEDSTENLFKIESDENLASCILFSQKSSKLSPGMDLCQAMWSWQGTIIAQS